MSEKTKCEQTENVASESVLASQETTEKSVHKPKVVTSRWQRVRSALKELAEDTKVTFDYLRNVGICGVLTLAIPQLDQVIQNIFLGWSELCGGYVRLGAMFGAFAIILGLYLFNALWLSFNIKRKPKSKLTGLISFLVVSFIITILFASGTTVKALQLLGYIA
ncbi:hypothetical protein J7X09_004504 [Vibrio parahaemolyticus]|nr:hypothetical protein [Vibrio parahaemolyticus]